MTRGFVLGKFLPPHDGHLLLCEFARRHADEVTILVCALGSDPIPGAMRLAWMRELCPWARVAYLDEDVPQEPTDHPQFWTIWRKIVRRAHPEPIDFVFASEPFGTRLADEVGARFGPFDMERTVIPVSGTEIRTAPYAKWRYLPPPVRAHYTKVVCLFGPESSGKTSLASRLAAEFETIAVPEHGRAYTALYGTECSRTDLLRIAEAQSASILAGKTYTNKLLVTDTDPLITSVWATMLLGEGAVDATNAHEKTDFYLLTNIDVPWEDDGTRYFPDPHARQKFYELCAAALENSGRPFAVLSGTLEERCAQAHEAVT